MRRVKFYTLGCKVNQYDTQSIREKFLNSGFKEIDNGKKADVYVINTCTVTRRADADSLNFIRRAKRENPGANIFVTGCLAELDADKIRSINKKIIIIKNKDKDRILFLTGKPACRQAGRLTGNGLTSKGISFFKGHTRAFLKVQDGCNNFCSYCKVPLVRGVSRSRPLKEIAQEANRLVENGFKEIVLCGICLGAYGKDLKPEQNLVDIIETLEEIEGLLRIRLSSIEAGDVTDELIKKIAESKKLCRHLHIPIQSGDDRILKIMHRPYTRSAYLALIRKIKRKIPQIAITTDVLVGFPGESEANFGNTLNLIKEIAPLKVHIFPYSKRPGTYACNFKNGIEPKLIKERILRLKNAADACARVYKKQFSNKKMEVLIEGKTKESATCWEGYTDNYIKVLVKSAKGLKNRIIPVKLRIIEKDYIRAELA